MLWHYYSRIIHYNNWFIFIFSYYLFNYLKPFSSKLKMDTPNLNNTMGMVMTSRALTDAHSAHFKNSTMYFLKILNAKIVKCLEATIWLKRFVSWWKILPYNLKRLTWACPYWMGTPTMHQTSYWQSMCNWRKGSKYSFVCTNQQSINLQWKIYSCTTAPLCTST